MVQSHPWNGYSADGLTIPRYHYNQRSRRVEYNSKFNRFADKLFGSSNKLTFRKFEKSQGGLRTVTICPKTAFGCYFRPVYWWVRDKYYHTLDVPSSSGNKQYPPNLQEYKLHAINRNYKLPEKLQIMRNRIILSEKYIT